MKSADEYVHRGNSDTVPLSPVTDADAIRRELETLLASPLLQGSDRQRRFLRYLVEETLNGRGALLKEYSIGVEVFGKDESFDPRIDTIVRVEARKLRAKVAKYYEEENSHAPVRIGFKRGTYAPVFVAGDESVETLSLPAEPSWESASPGFDWRRVAIVLVLVAIPLYLAYLWFQSAHESVTAMAPSSVAVLPFANLGDEKSEFFSDGLTDELIDSLGRVPGVRVAGRASVFQLRGRTLDLRQIGRKLNVRTVLEGSIRQSDGRIRITAELDDTLSGYRLWSQSYDRELKDILAIQRQISAAITATLRGTLASNESTAGSAVALGRGASVDSGAYEDYLRGRYFFNRSTAANVASALEYFHRAIQKDSTYAPAYVGVAACYVALPFHGLFRTRDVAPKIRAAGKRALELDRDLGEAHLDLAEAAEAELDWKTAYAEFQKGLELSPGSTIGHRWYSIFLARVGRLDDSLSEARKALELDPVSLFESRTVGSALYSLHRYDEAIEQFRKTLALEPNFGLAHLGLGLAYLQKDMYPEGVSEIQTAQQLLESDALTTAKLGYAFGLAGRKTEARKILDQLMRDSKQNNRPHSTYVADVYLGIGDKDAALHWLGRALEEGDPLPLNEEPAYDVLRSDPRFVRLLTAMKLPSRPVTSDQEERTAAERVTAPRR